MSKQVKLGRDPLKNDIVIDHPSVSREHLVLNYYDDGKVEVTDLNSSNGTFINGKRIEGTVSLKPLDILLAGFGDPIPWMEKEHGLSVTPPIIESNFTQKVKSDNQGASRVSRGAEVDTEVGGTPDRMRFVLIALLILVAIIYAYYKSNH
jgi:pSer/pThr/pTyr-binding forkhead associated (FHA) protein